MKKETNSIYIYSFIYNNDFIFGTIELKQLNKRYFFYGYNELKSYINSLIELIV